MNKQAWRNWLLCKLCLMKKYVSFNTRLRLGSGRCWHSMRHWRDESHRPADLGVTYHTWRLKLVAWGDSRALAQWQWLTSLCEIVLPRWCGSLYVRQTLDQLSCLPSSTIWFLNQKLCITVNNRSALFSWVIPHQFIALSLCLDALFPLTYLPLLPLSTYSPSIFFCLGTQMFWLWGKAEQCDCSPHPCKFPENLMQFWKSCPWEKCM